jgi:predicted small lipoprotein YifL
MFKKTIALLLAAIALASFAGCEKGPAEKAGEKVDKAMNDLKEKFK